MSMRDYAVHDYGIVFGEKEIEFASKILNIEDDDYEVAEEIGLEIISEFTGEANAINNKGISNYDNSINFNDDVIMYGSIKKWSSLFSAAYSSMAELVQELKDSYGKYLPNDFDYANNIREISGTYFG